MRDDGWHMIPLIGHLENGNILLLSALDRGHTKSGRRHNWNSGTAGVQVAALGLRRNSGQVTEWMDMKRVGCATSFCGKASAVNMIALYVGEGQRIPSYGAAFG
jgi:hypothetical protein